MKCFAVGFCLTSVVVSATMLCGCPSPGLAPDDGADAGPIEDAGVPVDGGSTNVGDAGVPRDAGSNGMSDAGESLDGGPSGMGDAGEPRDGGSSGMDDAGESRDGGSSSGGDAGDCDGGCSFGRMCCSGECINPANDPMNCGACGTRCTGSTPYCSNTCQAAPCLSTGPASCAADGGTCCGTSCCGAGQLCCDMEGPVAGYAACYTLTAEEPTCPQGCAPLCVSDREAKRDVEPVDDRAVLESLVQVPISTWSYKDDRQASRHLGPMAQDLHAAFGLGGTEKAYDPVDAHGVAFSSIRALYEMVRAQDARIEKLERENAALRARLAHHQQ
jgi:hypothetical protein